MTRSSAPSSYLASILMVLAVAALAATAPAHASLAWEDTCDELTSFQAYDFATIVAECKAAENPPSCPRCDTTCTDRWRTWVDCRLGGGNQATCKASRVEAMACKACYEGQVNTNGADQVLFVNPDSCNASNPPGGSNPSAGHTDPYCSLEAAILDAHAAQIATPALSTKVAVCPDTYREEINQVVSASGAPPEVIVEAVVQHEATVSGSEDWSTDWQEANPPNLEYHNLLPFSEDFSVPAGWAGTAFNGSFSATPVSIAGPFGAVVTANEILPVQGTSVYHSYDGSWGPGRYVLSVYAKIEGLSQVGLRMQGAKGDEATYKVGLPEAPCTIGPFEGADGGGYELIDPNPSIFGDEWYRIWVADSLLPDVDEVEPFEGLIQIRIDIDPDAGYAADQQRVWIWGAQLEHRPVDSFATTPRPYLATTGSTAKDEVKEFPVFERSGWTKDWGTQAWRSDWGCPVPEPTMLRQELLFIDSEPLRQVLRKDDLEPGTYFLDDGLSYTDPSVRWPAGGICPSATQNPVLIQERNTQCDPQNPCTLYVAPAGDTPDWNAAEGHFEFDRLEFAERTKTFWLHNSNEWTVRGLRFQHAAGEDMQGASAALLGARSPSFTDNLAEHNSGTGFGINGNLGCASQCTLKGNKTYASGTVMARNRAVDNGIIGASLFNQQDVTVKEEYYARNNWRGQQVGFNGGFVGGSKMGWIDGGYFSEMVVEDNYGNGLWFDHYGVDIEIHDLTSTGNRSAGLFLERHNNRIPSGSAGLSGPPANYTFEIYNSTFSGNDVGLRGSDAVHVLVADSTFEYNHDPKNNGAQVAFLWAHILDDSTPEGLLNGLHDWTLTNNNYAACSSDAFYFYSDTKAGASTAKDASDLFFTTFDSDDNVFEAHHTLVDKVGFRNAVKPIPVPNPAPLNFSLEVWQDYTFDEYLLKQDDGSCVIGEPGCP